MGLEVKVQCAVFDLSWKHVVMQRFVSEAHEHDYLFTMVWLHVVGHWLGQGWEIR